MSFLEHHGDSHGVLRAIQAQSEDFVRAVIPVTPTVFDPESGQLIAGVGLILYRAKGVDLIMREAAELILNDGILNRMRISIEFMNPQDTD
jgi:hypothetical protein